MKMRDKLKLIKELEQRNDERVKEAVFRAVHGSDVPEHEGCEIPQTAAEEGADGQSDG